jgi:hypothetical protein
MEFTCNQYSLTPPSDRFNLLDLDENEYYFKSLKVAMNDLNTEEFILGILHLNSRSLIFDPNNQALPLIKIRYNSNFEFECMSYEQIATLYDTINSNKTTINADSSLFKRNEDSKVAKLSPRKKQNVSVHSKKGKKTSQSQITVSPRYTLSEVYANNGKPFVVEENISDKLLYLINIHHSFHETSASKTFYPHSDYLLLNVHEAYLHPRSPRGPFSIKKYNTSFVFIIDEQQDKSRSFCKILKYLGGEKNPGMISLIILKKHWFSETNYNYSFITLSYINAVSDYKAKNYIDQLFKNELSAHITSMASAHGGVSSSTIQNL